MNVCEINAYFLNAVMVFFSVVSLLHLMVSMHIISLGFFHFDSAPFSIAMNGFQSMALTFNEKK